MNADGGILNILGRGHKYDGGAPLSGIVWSVASRNLPSLASAPAGGRPRGPGFMLSFRSLASPGERTTEGVAHLKQAPDRLQDGPPSFETIDRPCNVDV
jgi:hypothetical protein